MIEFLLSWFGSEAPDLPPEIRRTPHWGIIKPWELRARWFGWEWYRHVNSIHSDFAEETWSPRRGYRSVNVSYGLEGF